MTSSSSRKNILSQQPSAGTPSSVLLHVSLFFSTRPHDCIVCGCLQSKNRAPPDTDSSGSPVVEGGSSAGPGNNRGTPSTGLPAEHTKAGSGGPNRPTFEESYQLGKELGHGSFSTVREGISKVNYIILIVVLIAIGRLQ